MRKIFQIKFVIGTLDLSLASPEALDTSLRTPALLELNREVSRKGVVLLASHGILPLVSNTRTHIAVLGPCAHVLNTGRYTFNHGISPSYGSTIRRSLNDPAQSEAPARERQC